MSCCGGGGVTWRWGEAGGASSFGRYQVGRPNRIMEPSSVTTSAAPCCDACASKPAVEAFRPGDHGACGAGACSVRPAGATASPEAGLEAWAHDAGLRGAGRVSPIPTASTRTFDTSTDAELRALTDAELYQRETDLADFVDSANFSTDRPPSYLAAVEAELDGVRREQRRRESEDPYHDGGDGSGGSDGFQTPEERRRVAETVAREVAPGDTPADRARRDAIIARAVSGTLAQFNTWLEGNYRTRVEEIHSNRDITLQRLRNEDRAADREYRVQLANLNASGGGGGGGGGAAVGLGLLAALAAVLR